MAGLTQHHNKTQVFEGMTVLANSTLAIDMFHN